MKRTQQDKILRQLLRGRAVDPISALRLFGCFRLAARIRDLRERGYNIKSAFAEEDGKRFARYWLNGAMTSRHTLGLTK